MLELFFALFMAFSCPSHTPTNCHHHDGTVQTQGASAPNDPPPDDDGGDNGHVPPGFTSAPGN